MKRLLPFFSIAFLAACNTTPKEETAIIPTTIQAPAQVVDTAGFAQYQAWKAENELASVDEYNEPAIAAVAPVKKAQVKKAVAPVRKATKTKSSTPAPSRAPATSSADEDIASGDGGMVSESGQAAKAEKKGISKAAKGAVIGGVAGAAGGAVISKKNRVAGAVIGAVIGAGGGYVIGRQMDKKDGRIEYTPGFSTVSN